MTEEVLERESPLTAETGGETRQFVTFQLNGEVFAVDMAPVQEIIRLPQIVRVPLAPAALNGLSNLRGKVLPIISLRRMFGFDTRENDEATRVLVIDLGQPLGFVVDRVASVIEVESAHLEPVEGIGSIVDRELLTGILRDVGTFKMVMVVDFGRLVSKEFAGMAAGPRAAGVAGLTRSAADTADEGESDELQLVSFWIADQEYAIDISRVQEIVQVPDTIVHVPNQPAHVLGLMTLRERLLPLVSMRSLFGLPARALDERSRIVVVALAGMGVGLVTDSVSEVLRVPKDVADAMPTLLSHKGDLADIERICRIDGGKRLVSVISADNLFSHAKVREALQMSESQGEEDRPPTDSETGTEDEEHVVVFRLAEGEFGVPIGFVQEIVRVPEELTHVPKAPFFVEGVINLRGAVLPVVDQRKRLDLPPIERNDRQRVLVFLLGGLRTGFIVDGVSEVRKIPKALIEPAPKLSGEQARLIGRVANLEKQKRLIQLIDPMHLLDETDRLHLNTLDG